MRTEVSFGLRDETSLITIDLTLQRLGYRLPELSLFEHFPQ
jgi:hypothetical protein